MNLLARSQFAGVRLASLVFFILITAVAHARSVVVTTDCGADIDDQWAIVHLALTPNVKLLGVVGNFTPYIHGADTAECSRNMLRLIRKDADIPVFAGADVPLVNLQTPSMNDGVRFLINTSKNFSAENRLIVVSIGTATDVASAMIADPTFADRVEIDSLAFDKYPQGGDGWNVTNDIKAWQVVLDSNAPVVTCNGWLASEALTLQKTESPTLMAGLGPEAEFLASLHVNWLTANGQYFPETDGGTHWPIWDESVTGIILGMTEQTALPRPHLNDDQSFSFPNTKSKAPYGWVSSIDRERLFADLQANLSHLKSRLSPEQ